MNGYKHRATKRYTSLIVRFTSGRTVNYTDRILPLLLTDKTVKEIINAETGEIIKG